MFYSQFGEDRKLARIFAGNVGTCVEVGANDGVSGSNTLHFEENGWKSILIEPNPDLCLKLRARRSGIVHECAVGEKGGSVTLHIVAGPEGADGMSTTSAEPADHARFQSLGFTSRPVIVPCHTLDHVLKTSNVSPPIGFISIDVEGLELQVLRGLDLDAWKPRILLIEDNSGSRDTSIAMHLRDRGYERFDRTGVNDWYARSDDRELVNLSAWLRSRALSLIVPASRHLRQLPPSSMLRKYLRKIPGAAALARRLPF